MKMTEMSSLWRICDVKFMSDKFFSAIFGILIQFTSKLCMVVVFRSNIRDFIDIKKMKKKTKFDVNNCVILTSNLCLTNFLVPILGSPFNLLKNDV